MLLIGISIAVFLATLIGGSFALYLKDRLHLILGFSAGAVIAVAFFDLLPEALALAEVSYGVNTILAITALGFALYLILDRFFLLHTHSEHGEHEHNEKRGRFGALSLSLHSFLDGVGIGLAFQVSAPTGLLVAAAVLVHDFSDGINTVNMIMKAGGSRLKAFQWLLMDAMAPVVGILTTFFFSIHESQLGLLLALFAGFFLYLGASDLIPESHHAHPVYWTTVMTVVGMFVLYIAIRFAG